MHTPALNEGLIVTPQKMIQGEVSHGSLLPVSVLAAPPGSGAITLRTRVWWSALAPKQSRRRHQRNGYNVGSF